MFDSNTADVIRSARRLEGLDLAALSKRLTEAFASIVGMRASAAAGRISSDEVDWLRRLGDTYEACVCLMPEATRERSACAFVAATAHSLLARLAMLRGGSVPNGSDPRITPEGVSSAVSAPLLFMIAGAFADAREAARYLREDGNGADQIEFMIRMLCSGAYPDLRSVTLQQDVDSSVDLDASVVGKCWTYLAEGLQHLASYLLGDDDEGARAAETRFRAVQQASAKPVDDSSASLGTRATTLVVLGGPHHLATLLLRVLPWLTGHSMAHIMPPNGTDPTRWMAFVSALAEDRALLWQNHVRAIEQGFLTAGTSAVITFPTGAGKTTLVQLKLAVSLLAGKPVVCLVPTRALVDQTTRDLRRALRDLGEIRRALDRDEPASQEIPGIFVCTPEECLAALGQGTKELSTLGVVAFDECHLLHPNLGLTDHRSLEAMLCLLSLMEIAPSADILLLSAMVKNGRELSDWLQEASGRTCLSLDDTWKPTRQARGCIVYPVEEARALESEIATRLEHAISERGDDAGWSGEPRSRDKQDLEATPLGLFCLQQLWAVEDATDYSIQPVLDRKVPLSLGSFSPNYPRIRPKWYLTSNRYKVSADLAASLAAAGVQTLVLSQSTKSLRSTAERAAKDLKKRGVPQVELNVEERAWLLAAAEELGSDEHVVVFVGERTAIHHGMLLLEERAAAESLFTRADGVRILVVSPTMSQGMNLPAEAVIIAGDDRFDSEEERVMPLEAFELLNAAGRAGRAGSCANGIVIVVPGAVVTVAKRDGGYELAKRWFELQQRVFSNSDQCLVLSDPLELWLDELQAGITSSSVSVGASTLFYRLPAADDEARAFLQRTLAAHRRKARKPDFDAQLEQALRLRQELPPWKEEWHREVGVANGVPPSVIEDLARDVASIADSMLRATDWTRWWFDWLTCFPQHIRTLLPNDVLGEVVVLPDEPLDEDRFRALELVKECTLLWVQGRPLREVEQMLRPTAKNLGLCEHARRFALRVIPRIAWALGLIEQVRVGTGATVGLTLSRLASCVSLGLNTPEQLALFDIAPAHGIRLSRVQVHKRFALISEHLSPAVENEKWSAVRARVGEALESWILEQLR